MRLLAFLTALAGFITFVSATGIILPLYVYPSAQWNDGASNWKPVFKAVKAYPKINWLVVINPHNGPGLSGKPGDDDINVKSGLSQLNGFRNVKTVGYVHTDYAKASAKELNANITNWASWASYKSPDISVQGIFFDECGTDFDYLNRAITFARKSFKQRITTVCNFGVKAAKEYYGICDVVVGFESCLNCGNGPRYKGQTTINNNFPTQYRPQSAVIVNQFNGRDYGGSTASASLLNKYAKTLVDNAIGWFYFCSADYNDIITAPATVGQNADSLAKASA